jgi:PAS domain S-box-containing protein
MADRPLRILLVEDDEDDYILTRDLLEEVQAVRYEAIWVQDYASGLDALRNGRFDACLLDHRLGAERGIDLLREVVSHGCRTPIIVLTGLKDPQIDAEAMEAGAAGYLVKGTVDATGLDRAIRYAIDERRRSQDKLEHRLAIERAAAIISRMLVASPGPEFVDVLRVLGGVVPADRSFVARLAREDPHPTVEASDGFDPEAQSRLAQDLASLFPEHWIRALKCGDAVALRDATAVPSEALLDKSFVGARGVSGLLLIPVASSRGELLGFVGFETTREPGRWPGEDIEALLVIADIIRAFWERQSAETEHVRLVTAIEQAGEAIVVTDPDGNIQYVNPAFERVTGYSRDEAVGKNPRMLKSGEHDAAFYEGLWETLSGGSVWTGRFVNRRKDGTVYHEEATISPVRDATGRTVNYVATKRDVTRELEIEEQLRQSQKMEAIGQLAGGIAHDLNNILTVVNGHAELLAMSLSGQEQPRRDALEISKAGQRAGSLVQQILAFSRKQLLQPRVLSLNEVVTGVEEMLRRLIGESIEMAAVKAPDLGSVEADPSQLEQIVMNLAVNSRDAMPSGGRLRIETANVEIDAGNREHHPGVGPGRYVMLAVTDTGTGMDAETKKRIFEPFFTTKGKGKGTGLGLATVYGIVKQSGGDVGVQTEPGRGTTFRIYLPRVDREAEPVRRPAQPSAASAKGSETVLVVEDEATLREFICTVLRGRGYNVLAASDGLEALRIAGEHDGPLHLAITDVMMPHMGGAELALELATLKPDTRVLYMSGYPDNAITNHGVIDPSVSFLPKPFTPGILADKVREVLAGPPAPPSQLRS